MHRVVEAAVGSMTATNHKNRKEKRMKMLHVTHRFSTLAIALFAVIAITATSSMAAIVVESSAYSTEEQGNYIANPETLTWSAGSFRGFSLSGADKLVVTFGMRHSGTPAAAAISNVTYNGQAMSEAVGTGVNDPYESAIWYLDNPGTTTGDLVADMARGYGAAATLWSLSGTAYSVGDTGSSAGSNSTSLTTTAANSLVIAHATVEGDPDVPVAQSPLTGEHGFNVLYDDPGGRNHSIGTGYQTVASSGTGLTPTFDIGDTTVAAEFTSFVIPEPTTALLAAFGLLGVLFRRPRRK